MQLRLIISAAIALLLLPGAWAAGDVSSAEALVRLLNSGASGAPKTYAEAAEVVAADAAQGKPLQQYVMALFNEERLMPSELRLSPTRRDEYYALARPKIKALAEKSNNPLAWYLMALDTGDTNLLCRAAEGGNVQAANAWGMMMINAVDGPLVDPAAKPTMAKAFQFFKDAAALGDANALYNMGMCYARGLGVEVDDAKALMCFRAAAHKGHPLAINNLGWLFLKGKGLLEDHEEAARWFAKSAEMGNAIGQFNYALALQTGDGVEVDERTAARLMEKSALQGNIDAMNAWGVCLWKGRGVGEDAKRAVEWFRRAAREGAYPPAMDNLSACYERGIGVAQNESKALEWKMRGRAARGEESARDWLMGRKLKLQEE